MEVKINYKLYSIYFWFCILLFPLLLLYFIVWLFQILHIICVNITVRGAVRECMDENFKYNIELNIINKMVLDQWLIVCCNFPPSFMYNDVSVRPRPVKSSIQLYSLLRWVEGESMDEFQRQDKQDRP